MHEIKSWLTKWFFKNGKKPDEGDIRSNQNYFDAGLIDSFGVILLIDAIEAEYKIVLTSEHFEQRRFSTIDGLCEIIHEEQSEIA